MTKVEIAVEYIKKHGLATTVQLNKALGLHSRESAASYLSSAVDRGALIRKGRVWTLPNQRGREVTAVDLIIGNALRPSPDVT